MASFGTIYAFGGENCLFFAKFTFFYLFIFGTFDNLVLFFGIKANLIVLDRGDTMHHGTKNMNILPFLNSEICKAFDSAKVALTDFSFL